MSTVMNTVLTAHDPLNPLIAKDSVGKSKHFSYGKPNLKDLETAGSLTSTWKEHTNSIKQMHSHCVDFLSMNVATSKLSGSAAAALIARIKAKKPKSATEISNRMDENQRPQPKTHVSGKASAARISISEVVCNKFGNEGEKASVGRYEEYLRQRIAQAKIKVTVRPTKASAGHATREALVEAKEPFKLSKFKKVPSRLNIH